MGVLFVNGGWETHPELLLLGFRVWIAIPFCRPIPDTDRTISLNLRDISWGVHDMPTYITEK